jgi:hypothetical protein
MDNSKNDKYLIPIVKELERTSLTRIDDNLIIDGNLIPYISNEFTIGNEESQFKYIYASEGDFIIGPTGTIGFNTDGSIYSKD